jgi:hypothetical protein
MNPPKPHLRKDIEKRRASLPVRPLPTPPPAARPPEQPTNWGRWAVFLIILAIVGWFVGRAVSSLRQPDDFKLSGLDNLPTKSRVLAVRPELEQSGSDETSNAAPLQEPVNDSAAQLADQAFVPGPYALGEVIFRAGSPEQLAALVQRAQAVGGTLLGTIPEADSARFAFPDPASMAGFVRDGSGDGSLLDPQLNYTVSLPAAPTAAIDPFAPGSLRPFGNTVMPYLGVPRDNANWGQGVVVAMLDTGLAPGTTNILTGTGGAISQYDMTGSPDAPTLGHGDMVVSLLAGANGEQGIVPAASLISIRVLGANDEGNVYGVTDGIYTAIAHGAQVLNLSLGTNQTSSILQDAINYALSQNVVVVAAAGNDGNGQISYPAAYPGVIAVGAVDATGQRASFSDYGPEMVIAAPGVGINTVTTGGIMSFSGTSAASPLVAGAIAGLMSTNPNLTGQQAQALLTHYADFAGPVTDSGTNEFYGAGGLDVGRVLDRGNTSLSDVAVADLYLNVTSMPTTPTAPMEVSIQNRGNTVLDSVLVTVDVNGTPTTQTFTGLQPTEVRAMDVDLPVPQLTTTGVQVTARADSGQPEYKPGDSVKSRIVQLIPASGTTSLSN